MAEMTEGGGFSPLHYAAVQGNANVVRHLLTSCGAALTSVVNDSANETKAAPLHWAAIHGSLEVVSLLLHAGAQLDVKDGLGQTAAMLAAQNDILKVIRDLMDKGDIKAGGAAEQMV